ncbi:hypothetical protein JCM21142_52286 [Saccharicrinis fermentans DSM 9555 = JCM 21142]|uniref:Outer membrane protein beta-barrel domain-containing protein n=1 Tax=Saccharicrinis fermentans DSM 9555 = JCM 21142 TaxID=869213 RepID=W7Y7I4_9BACT|nr:hypothetical protein JCM21142_52286 [Saccharicrinis fermentans DSM 9555 = JCM 21142]
MPFSPSVSALFNVRYLKPTFGFVRNAYVSVDYLLTASQNNIVPPEEKTPGYQLFNMGLGGDVSIKNQV